MFGHLHQFTFISLQSAIVLQNFNLLKSRTQRRSTFNNMDLVWRKDVRHGVAHIIEVECAYIPQTQVLKNLNNEQNHETPQWNETFISEYPTRKCKNAKNPKPLRPYLV